MCNVLLYKEIIFIISFAFNKNLENLLNFENFKNFKKLYKFI